MKALSIQEPYAWLILQKTFVSYPKPIKDVENRRWPLPKNFTLPQRIYVHASLTMYDVSLQELRDRMSAMQWREQKDHLYSMYRIWDVYKNRRDELKKSRYFGKILGEVDITGCKFRFGEENDNLYSPWHIPGQYGFSLENPVLYVLPIPYRGLQKFFEVELPEAK